MTATGTIDYQTPVRVAGLVEFGRAGRGRQRSALAMRDISVRREGRPHSILLVEDDSIMAMAMRDELAASGYDVVGHADDGQDAVELAETHEPDLVVMDVRLRGTTDGIAAARAIKQRIATRIVFVTAHVDPTTRSAMAEVGYDALLAKPYTSEQLLRTVQSALER